MKNKRKNYTTQHTFIFNLVFTLKIETQSVPTRNIVYATYLKLNAQFNRAMYGNGVECMETENLFKRKTLMLIPHTLLLCVKLILIVMQTHNKT